METAIPTDKLIYSLSDYISTLNGLAIEHCHQIPGLSQRAAVQKTLTTIRRPLSHPIAPLYLAVRAHGVAIGEAAVQLGIGIYLLHYSLRLIDDIYDGDAHADLDGAIGTNVGMTIFLAAIDCIWAWEQRTRLSAEGCCNNLRLILVSTCNRMASGQHRDIAGRQQSRKLPEALALACDKNAITVLLYQMVAFLVAAQQEHIHHYQRIGENFAAIIQIINDLTELFGDAKSSDLRTETYGIPLIVFFTRCDEADSARWRSRIKQEREAVRPELWKAMFANGTMVELVEHIESARLQILEHLCALSCEGPYLAMLLAWLDDLISFLYFPPTYAKFTHTIDIVQLSGDDSVLGQRLADGQQATAARYQDRQHFLFTS